MYIGIPTAEPTRATGIQLLLNSKLLWYKSFLQHRQGVLSVNWYLNFVENCISH